MKVLANQIRKRSTPVRATAAAVGLCLTVAAMAAGVTMGTTAPPTKLFTTQVGVPVTAPMTTTAPVIASAQTSFLTRTSSFSTAVELASIPSNFDVASELVPSWGNGAIPASGAPDVVGAFRFICNAGQLAADDPIVYPGQPGRAHLHQFFGNTAANASSTYASLRTTGQSTCNSPLNRSAYWMPAMMNGRGKVVRPDYISIYYKRRPITDPKCNPASGDPQAQGICVDLPRGLKFVFGADMANMAAPKTGSGYFNCDGATAKPGHYPDIVMAAKNCPVGNKLGAIIGAPDCWDGRNLDSPDHRSHVAYMRGGEDHNWVYKCPTTHPYVIPTFTMGVWYTTDADLDRSGTWSPSTPTWHLSSDAMPGMPMMKPGSTFHADWFGAWDDSVMKMWTENCINKLLNCSGGDLGNGKQLKMYAGFKWDAEPRLVDVPSTQVELIMKPTPILVTKLSVCNVPKRVSSKYLDQICGRI